MICYGYTLLKNNRLYHHGYAMYIDELYVIEAQRGQGIGSALFQTIARAALQSECNRLEWWVEQNNVRAIEFYESIGARVLDKFKMFRLLKPALENL